MGALCLCRCKTLATINFHIWSAGGIPLYTYFWQYRLCILHCSTAIRVPVTLRPVPVLTHWPSFDFAGQTAGIVDPNGDGEPATVALEALRQLKTRVESTQKELEEYKLKVKSCQSSSPKIFTIIVNVLRPQRCIRGCRGLQTQSMRALHSINEVTMFWCWQIRIVEEKQRLNEMRVVHSPMKAIGSFGAQNLAPR